MPVTTEVETYFATVSSNGDYIQYTAWCESNDSQIVPLNMWWMWLGRFLYARTTYPAYTLEDALALCSRDSAVNSQQLSTGGGNIPVVKGCTTCGGGTVL